MSLEKTTDPIPALLDFKAEAGSRAKPIEQAQNIIYYKFSWIDRVVMWLMMLGVMILIGFQLFVYCCPVRQISTVIHERVNVYTTEFQWMKINRDPMETWMLSGMLLEQGHMAEAKLLLQYLKQSFNVPDSMALFWNLMVSEQIERIEHLMHDPYAIDKESVAWWMRLGIQTRFVNEVTPWHRSLSDRTMPIDMVSYQKDYEKVLAAYRVTLQAIAS